MSHHTVPCTENWKGKATQASCPLESRCKSSHCSKRTEIASYGVQDLWHLDILRLPKTVLRYPYERQEFHFCDNQPIAQ